MKININGQLLVDNSLDYDRIHQLVNDNSYNSLGDAIASKIQTAIENTEWYHQRPPSNFDLTEDFEHVKSICGPDLNCYWDSANWTIMNKTELTADIYKFITNRFDVVRDGFLHNFWPQDHAWHQLIQMIDWHFILDCISWFF